MNTETLDKVRLEVNSRLDQKNKSKLGQFMTAAVVADYMASLFDKNTKNVNIRIQATTISHEVSTNFSFQ